MQFILRAIAGAMLFTASSLHAQSAVAVPAPASPKEGVPVFPVGLVERPYETLGAVKATSRRATVSQSETRQTEVYRELWKRAKKLGADAVIIDNYGDVTGTAIKFTEPAPSRR